MSYLPLWNHFKPIYRFSKPKKLKNYSEKKMDAYRNRQGRSQLQRCWWHQYIGDIMLVTHSKYWWQNHYVGPSVKNPSSKSHRRHQNLIDVTKISKMSSTFFVVKVTRKSVNMTAVGVFIGANVLFIIGFAILFVCQKRILSKAMLPNTGI